MPLSHTAGARARLAGLIVVLVGGCRSAATHDCTVHQPESAVTTGRQVSPLPVAPGPVATVSYHQADEADTAVALPVDDPFAGQLALRPEHVVQEVLARNPSLQAMIFAWQAAAQRYPQVVSLDDPMFGFMVAPAAWGSDDVDDGYMLEASQQVPWPGKRQLRGRSADAEARAARLDIDDSRLQLVEMAHQAFLEYYLAHRQRELNDENLSAMQEFQETASSKYRANEVEQQDVLQADVEVAELQQRQFELQRMRRVAISRINTLMLRAPDHPLPAPPRRLLGTQPPPDAALLQQLAFERRPDLAALDARIRAEAAAVDLAYKEFYPDFEVVARYDAFWQRAEDDLRPQLGMNIDVPIQKKRRWAAVREATFRLNQRRAEYEQRVANIQNDVQGAFERLTESHAITELYSTKVIPAATQNVEAARSGYVAGTVDFLRLVEAQRQLIMLQEKRAEAEVDYYRRLAELERTVGGPVTFPESPEELPVPAAD